MGRTWGEGRGGDVCGGGLRKTMHVTLHSTHNMHTDRMLNYRHVQIHVCNYHTTQAHLQGIHLSHSASRARQKYGMETQNSKAWSDGRLKANMEWSQQTWNGASKWSLQQATGTQQ